MFSNHYFLITFIRIQVEKFGTTLISRPAGREAFLAFQPVLREISSAEKIEVNFSGVAVLTPSWADEFLTPLYKKYKGRIELFNTDKPTIKESLEILGLI